MDIQEALKRMVRIAMTAKHADDVLRNAGYMETPYWQIYGDAVDAIYCLVEKEGTDFESSTTCLVMGTVSLTGDRRVALLLDAHSRNHR